MNFKNKITSAGAAILVVTLLAACSGTETPKEEPTIGAPPGVSAPHSPSSADPSPEVSLSPTVEPPKVEGSDLPKDNSEYKPRDQQQIFLWEKKDLKPLDTHKESFSGDDVEFVMIDTLLTLQTLASFTDYQETAIAPVEAEILGQSLATEELTESAAEKLVKMIKEDDPLSLIALPHLMEGADANGRIIDYDDTRSWGITYSDFVPYEVLPPGGDYDNPQARFKITQTLTIPDKSGDTVALKSEMMLFMEPGFDKWVLNDWGLLDMTAEWSSK